MKELGFEVQQQARAEILIEETIRTSEIEGERLDRLAVRSSVARRLGLPLTGLSAPVNRAADGVVDILLDATQHHDRDLTDSRLFGWHAALFPLGYSGLHPIKVGGWREDRDGPMRVVSGPIGREKIHYEAPPAASVADEMQAFRQWWHDSRGSIDGLVRAALAHLRFVAIHPFEDGNGRIARTITEMALAQEEGEPVRYYSLSAQIMAEREEYYAILDRTNRGDGEVTEWLVWSLHLMRRAILKSNDLLGSVLSKHKFWQRHAQCEFSDRQRKVINRLLDAGPEGFEGGLTNRKYVGLTGASRATAQRELADLVDKVILKVRAGGGRSTSYELRVFEAESAGQQCLG